MVWTLMLSYVAGVRHVRAHRGKKSYLGILYRYILYDEEGIPTLCRGGYLISENGYLEYIMEYTFRSCRWFTNNSIR